MLNHWKRWNRVPCARFSRAGVEKGYETIEDLESASSVDDPESIGEFWMSRLDDERLVSSLSIPGTHDSAAYTSPWPFISTQNMSISRQLNSGIRYFDLRVGLRNDVAEMCHGMAFLGIRLSEVLSIMYEFLESHPREAIIVQIKQDRKPQQSTVHFSHAIFQHISDRSERWRTTNSTPTLAELRGKIQLFRRYTGHSLVTYGIDVTQWQDNPTAPFTIYNKLQLVTVQDHYSYSDPKPLPSLVESKGGDVAVLLESASRNPDPAHWYINFMSAYEINLYFQIPPRNIAVGGYYLLRWVDGINARVQAYLQDRAGGKRFGIVAMDYPELGATELISLIILSNFDKANGFRKIMLLVLVLLLIAVLLFGSFCTARLVTCPSSVLTHSVFGKLWAHVDHSS